TTCPTKTAAHLGEAKRNQSDDYCADDERRQAVVSHNLLHVRRKFENACAHGHVDQQRHQVPLPDFSAQAFSHLVCYWEREFGVRRLVAAFGRALISIVVSVLTQKRRRVAALQRRNQASNGITGFTPGTAM